MTPPPRGLTALVAAEDVAETTAAFVLRSHGAELHPFVGLLVRFGKAAARDVQVLHEVLSLSGSTLSEAAIGRGWSAVRRLAAKARTLPPGPERELVGYEVERAMQGLLAREKDFAVGFTEAIEHGAAEMRAARAEAAVKGAGTLVKSAAPSAGAKVLSRLAVRIDAATLELRGLWKRFEAAPGAADGLRLAADIAAQRAQAMLALLRQRGLTAAQRLSMVWGHLSNIRGPLGEGYGLGNAVWYGKRAEELARARKIAAALGPGHTAEYLTQAAHNLRVNGAEGPDAMVVILNRATKTAYDPARVQVKIATASEGALQSGNDVLRSVGIEAGRVPRPANLMYTPAPGEDPVAYLLSTHPDVRTRLYLVNAAGSHTPAADLDALRAFGMAITELRLDLTITHFTHLTLSVAESALDVLRRVP